MAYITDPRTRDTVYIHQGKPLSVTYRGQTLRPGDTGFHYAVYLMRPAMQLKARFDIARDRAKKIVSQIETAPRMFSTMGAPADVEAAPDPAAQVLGEAKISS